MTVVYKDLKHIWWARGVDLTQEEAEKRIRIALVARGVIPIDAAVECQQVSPDGGEQVYVTMYTYEPKRAPKPRRQRSLYAGDRVICRGTSGTRSVYGNVVEVLRVTRGVYFGEGGALVDRVRVQGVGQYGFDQWNMRSDAVELTDLPLSEAIQF